ncbi:N-acetylgalactosamine kinase [Trichinella nativa]|uniref:N-acetylgalactosamine kinase n=1 Tax=Trichinella nativa TaxID=6335 RepID=A0A0V1L9I1_9BILA|nr:N-acetylgalactosamine kinase [Trichinella nativa]
MMESTNDVSQFSELLRAFRDRYNCEAEYVVKSPGRMNIIGEHIDYSGYPVLPMAVNECIYAAFSVNQNSEEITVCNTDPKYEPFEALYSYFIISGKNLSWKDYFLTGVVAAMDHIEEYQYKASEDAEVKLTFKGFKAMISNKLPERRGFAISTALVCCAAACTMVAVGDGNFRTITKENLAELCSQYENADLVRGPMDNLICFTARQGAAKYIQFNPLRLDDVTLPPNARFLVFHCGLQSTKNAMFPLFRKRVTECRLATKVFIAKVFGLDWRAINTIREVQDAVAGIDDNTFKEIALSPFRQVSYTIAEIIRFLQCNESELDILRGRRYRTKEQFYLKRRARHVIEESMRVKEFRSICDQFANGQLSEDLCLSKLGKLLDDSHHSCSYFYDCTCEELDFIQQMFKLAANSFSILFYAAIFHCFLQCNLIISRSRLTGLGWGGPVVALIDAERAESFKESIEKYIAGSAFRSYKPFFVSPGQGLQIFSLPHN